MTRKRVVPAVIAVLAVCLASGLLVAIARWAPADSAVTSSVTVLPTDDATVSQATPTTNFGASPSLAVNGASHKVKRAYLKFTVTGVPAGASLLGAQLVIQATNSSGVQPALRRQTAGSWNESTITYAKAPAMGSVITTSQGVKAGPITFAVQNVVKGNGTFSFALAQGSSKETTFASKESATPPQLTVTYSAAGPTPTATPSDTAPPTPGPDHPCGTTSAAPATYDHIIWILMENKTYSQVIGDKTDAPYINTLASKCASVQGMADGGSSVDSLANYLALTSGDLQGVTENVYPPVANVHADNLFDQVLRANMTAKSYAENMSTPCQATDPGTATALYRVKHNPWPYYLDDAANCSQFDVPMGSLTSGPFHDDLVNNTLPTFAFITPNMVNDMHTGSSVPAKIRSGDAWLSQWMPAILGSPGYQAGHTAVFLLWDEEAPVPNVFMAPSVVPGTVVAPAVAPVWSHYSVLRTTEEMLGIQTYLLNAASAPSLRSVLNF